MNDPAAEAPKDTKRSDGELTIIAGGRKLAGWEEIEVTLSAEAFPNSFDIGMSSREKPGEIPKAGDDCTVMLGNDQVIVGYVDRDVTGGDKASHSIRLVGRGKTQDLVDCSAEWPSGQLIQGDALSISNQIALPYGIAVELGDGASAGPKVPQWALNYGETGAAIVQRLARNAGLLAYEDSHGKLILASVGTKQAGSGVVYGQNVESWSAENGMDGRFSDVVCSWFSIAAYDDLPGSDFFDKESDPNVPRHRQLDIVLETVATDVKEFTITKAKWEVARRAGRAAVVRATIDSWRDKDGKLWAPNTLVPVDVPGNRAGKQLVLSEVTFRRSNERGTTADLMLMPPAAFSLEPITLNPANTADVSGPPQ